MRDALAVTKRTLVSFYDDQMTHHAAALTYYGLMSLFPTALLALSLLGLLGEYPSTYDAIINYLSGVAPRSVVILLDSSLRGPCSTRTPRPPPPRSAWRWPCTEPPVCSRPPAGR